MADEPQIISTEHMQTAAALMAQGDEWKDAGASTTGRPGIYAFHVEVPAGQEALALEIVERCRPRGRETAPMDVMVHLGRYEAAFRRIRRMRTTLQEQEQNDD